jgi:hypothetical protein
MNFMNVMDRSDLELKSVAVVMAAFVMMAAVFFSQML